MSLSIETCWHAVCITFYIFRLDNIRIKTSYTIAFRPSIVENYLFVFYCVGHFFEMEMSTRAVIVVIRFANLVDNAGC